MVRSEWFATRGGVLRRRSPSIIIIIRYTEVEGFPREAGTWRLLYIGVYRSDVEEFTPLSLKTNGLGTINSRLLTRSPQIGCDEQNARCAGIVRDAVLCPYAKDALFVPCLL